VFFAMGWINGWNVLACGVVQIASSSTMATRGAVMRRDSRRPSNPFFTIGHSTRPVEEFIDLLKGAQIALLVDVRSVPRSRTNPQYNCDILPETLARSAIGYEHMAALGGLRARQDAPPAVNAFWQNQSFHNFADYALTPAFRSALARLRTLGHERRCAIMCAEAVWWGCHRRIIADYLIAAGETVFHILSADRVEPARMTEAAKACADGSLVYGA
jgi:uncharacterized protein (DUF488 family)